MQHIVMLWNLVASDVGRKVFRLRQGILILGTLHVF
jgi:hypothetical protein